MGPSKICPSGRGLAWAAAVAALAGAIAGWSTPRGPVSAAQALSAMAISAIVGVVAGAVTRSRWAMLVGPAGFMAAFELVRLDATGPTVDAINVGAALGMVAFAVGRIFHGLLAVLPMMVGVAIGRAWARCRTPGPISSSTLLARAARGVRRTVLAATTIALLLLAAGIARPATTDAIVGPDGEPLPGSITELVRVEIGGHDQAMLIRGASAESPVLLFLAGGPGGTELGTMRRYGGLLERDFVVVTWDQRGTGKSYGSLEPTTTLTFEQVVADTIVLTEYLRTRFDDEQIYLASNSYGALVGARAAQARPDVYAAFVGTGQMVNVRETDRMFYEDTLAFARQTGNESLVETLLAQGQPPYEDLLDYAPLVAGEQDWNDYGDVDGHRGKREPSENLFVSEYTLMEKVGSVAGLLETYSVLYPQLQDLDLRRDVPRLEVPVYLVQGKYEARGRAVLANEWFDLFTRYNRAVWPAHVVAYGLGLLVLVLLRRPGTATDRLTAGALAAMWLWLGVMFQVRHAAQLDAMLGAVYGVLFVGQAVLFVRAGVVGDRLSFTTGRGVAGRVGWLALGYALVVYPLIGIALGHGYPEAPLFGMAPCPTIIATFGLLLLARPPLPMHLLAIPLAWGILAPVAAVGHGVLDDIGLFVVGTAAVVILVHRDRDRDRGRRLAAAAPLDQPLRVG